MSGDDVVNQDLLTPGAAAQSSVTLTATAVFVPVPGVRYYTTFTVINGKGLERVVTDPQGLLYTLTPPFTRPEYLGRGTQAGQHLRYVNDTKSAGYTTGSAVDDQLADLTRGTIQLVACAPGGAACSTVDVLYFTGGSGRGV